MKHLAYLLILVFVAFSYISCNDSTIDEAWKDANWKAYEAIKADLEYRDVRSISKNQTGPLGVYFKVVNKGTETEHPIETSKVSVLYHGYYYDETVFDAGSSGNGLPVEFITGETVRGFSFALQNMVVGDKWKICIPYYLGYGAAGRTDNYGNIVFKGYTTLFFDVELVSITQYP